MLFDLERPIRLCSSYYNRNIYLNEIHWIVDEEWQYLNQCLVKDIVSTKGHKKNMDDSLIINYYRS